MSQQPMRGMFPVLITPFDEQDRIDEDSLRSVVEYNINAGVHGVVIAFATEIMKLTEAERLQIAKVVVDQTRGRVPVVVNTGAVSTAATVQYSQQTEDLGVTSVMCTPPAAECAGGREKGVLQGDIRRRQCPDLRSGSRYVARWGVAATDC